MCAILAEVPIVLTRAAFLLIILTSSVLACGEFEGTTRLPVGVGIQSIVFWRARAEVSYFIFSVHNIRPPNYSEFEQHTGDTPDGRGDYTKVISWMPGFAQLRDGIPGDDIAVAVRGYWKWGSKSTNMDRVSVSADSQRRQTVIAFWTGCGDSDANTVVTINHK
jgi:hypothetical protein